MIKINKYLHLYIPIILSLLFLTNLMSLFYKRLDLSDYGKVSIELTLIIAILLLVVSLFHNVFTNKQMQNNLVPLYISFFALFSCYIISHLINQNIHYDKALIYLFLSYFVFLGVFLTKWNKYHYIILSATVYTLVTLTIFYWLNNGMVTNRLGRAHINTNLLGITIFCLIYFQLLTLNHKINFIKIFQCLVVAGSLVLIYVTSSRAVILVLITVIASWFLLKLKRKWFKNLFYLVMLFNVSFIYFYTQMADSQLLQQFNKLSREFFKKDIFSGRESIWRDAIDYGLTSPFWGHHVDIRPKDFLDTHLSHVHNYYIQVFLEIGLIGLLAFIVFLFIIWKIYNDNLDNFIVQLSACFFIGILVYWNIEFNSFFVNQSIHLLFWFIIGIGLSASIYNKKQKRVYE